MKWCVTSNHLSKECRAQGSHNHLLYYTIPDILPVGTFRQSERKSVCMATKHSSNNLYAYTTRYITGIHYWRHRIFYSMKKGRALKFSTSSCNSSLALYPSCSHRKLDNLIISHEVGQSHKLTGSCKALFTRGYRVNYLACLLLTTRTNQIGDNA